MSDGTQPAGPGEDDLARPRPLVALDAALNRLGLRGPLARDGTLAVVLAAVSVAVLTSLLGPFSDTFGITISPRAAAAVLVLVGLQTLALAIRRLAPRICLLGVTAFQLALVAVVPDDITVRVAAPLVAAYTVGTCLPTRQVVRWVGLAALVEVVGGVLVWTFFTPTVRFGVLGLDSGRAPWTAARFAQWALSDLFVVVLYLAAALAGVFVTTRRDYIALLQAREAAAVAEQEVRARRAVDAERARMARELHDVAAHHLSGLVVQAAAAERLIDRDPAAAKAATRSLRHQGREALTNLRALVGVLRQREVDADTLAGVVADTDEPEAPVPGVAVLDALIQKARRLGDDVHLDVVGASHPLSPIPDLTVYRVLQESLANARQHAAGMPVHVRLHYTPRGTRLEVENRLSRAASSFDDPTRSDPTGSDRSGFGLLGMRERADLAGSTLAVGPSPAGTWRVRLDLPPEIEPTVSFGERVSS